jgi:hypothetical protein
MRRLLLLVIASLLCASSASAQITPPYIFVNGTAANADEVNADIAKFADALNRTGGTMTGTLNTLTVLPVTTGTYALGSSLLRWSNGYFQVLDVTGGSITAATITASGIVSGLSLNTQSTSGINTIADVWVTNTNINVGNTTNALAEMKLNQNGYSLGGQFRDLSIYDGKGTQLVFVSNALTADNGVFIANGKSLHVGALARVGRSITNSTNAINIYDGTAPVGTGAGFVSLYSTAGELRVMDAAGNATLLSPHDDVTNDWVYDSVDSRTGRHLRIDVERLLKALDAKLGGGYVRDTDVARMKTTLVPWLRGIFPVPDVR